jgi:hypothetical protein
MASETAYISGQHKKPGTAFPERIKFILFPDWPRAGVTQVPVGAVQPFRRLSVKSADNIAGFVGDGENQVRGDLLLFSP